MTAFAGSALFAHWIYSGGTVVLSGDFRNMDDTDSLEIIDATAGADAHRDKLPYLRDGQLVITMVSQTLGTALYNALVPGTQGTIVYGEEGSATGKPKHTVAAFVSNRQRGQPYNDIVELSVTFEKNGVATDAAW